QHLAGGLLDLGAALPQVHQWQGAFGMVAEDDVDLVERDCDFGRGGHFASPFRSIRSSTMATTTMTKPDSNPNPVLTERSALTHRTPSPSAPTSAAITTTDSDSMIVWFSPAMICGSA